MPKTVWICHGLSWFWQDVKGHRESKCLFKSSKTDTKDEQIIRINEKHKEVTWEEEQQIKKKGTPKEVSQVKNQLVPQVVKVNQEISKSKKPIILVEEDQLLQHNVENDWWYLYWTRMWNN